MSEVHCGGNTVYTGSVQIMFCRARQGSVSVGRIPLEPIQVSQLNSLSLVLHREWGLFIVCLPLI